MPTETQTDPRNNFVPRFLPWLLGAAMMTLYCLTLNHSVSLFNWSAVSKISGWTWQPEVLKRFLPEATAVILDPPRKGCQPEILELLRKARPAQVVYVSCHPATMARDLNILCAEGVFDLARVQPLDMFPQTQHVECVADLRAGQNLAKPQKMDSTGSTHGDGNTN